ncbi:MAG: hypothetical protein R3285_02035 [Kiloniellales bacterium]|nr:hypothetical protein [Kiloniellales bacterium]
MSAEPERRQIAALVDLDRYPIDAPGSAGHGALVTRCRDQLNDVGCAVLPGFLSEVGLRALRAESAAVSSAAYYSRQHTNVYFSADDESLPEDHPKRMFFHRTSAFVPADAFPAASVIRRIYDWPALMPFFQDCLEEPVLHKYADPLADVILNVLNPGEEFPWHFDTNEFSISIMTQKAEAGGLFEFCPNLRDPRDENYEGVRAVLEGGREPVVTLDIAPGDLQIFKGRYSMHRVTRVAGRTARYMAIYAYAREPDMVGRLQRTRQLYGKVLPVHLEAEARRRADGLVD